MPIRKGTSVIAAVRKGTDAIGKVYKGSTLLFSAGGGGSAPVAYRFWRLEINTSNGPGYVGAAEVQLRTLSGGPNVATGGTASARSSDTGADPGNAFDGNLATVWASTNVGWPEWLQYDLGAGNEKSITQFTYTPRQNYFAEQSPLAITVKASNDGIAFDTIWSTGPITWPTIAQQVFTRP